MAKHAQHDPILIGQRIDIASAGPASPDRDIPPERPFTDTLPHCEQKWSELLAGQRYQNARVTSALYTYEAPGLPARAL